MGGKGRKLTKEELAAATKQQVTTCDRLRRATITMTMTQLAELYFEQVELRQQFWSADDDANADDAPSSPPEKALVRQPSRSSTLRRLRLACRLIAVAVAVQWRPPSSTCCAATSR